MVSTARFDLGRVVDVLTGFILLGTALRQLKHIPSLAAVLGTIILLSAAVLILYSMWILIISLAFYVVKVDNLSFLFSSIYDAARWPASIFRGVLSFIFTFIIPLAIMTTYPALAILDRLALWRALTALASAVAFASVARWTWKQALRRYTSAGG